MFGASKRTRQFQLAQQRLDNVLLALGRRLEKMQDWLQAQEVGTMTFAKAACKYSIVYEGPSKSRHIDANVLHRVVVEQGLRNVRRVVGLV